MTERRKSPRTRTLKSGRIVFTNRSSVVNCTIRNLSAGGCLLLADVTNVPERFTLIMDAEKTEHACAVAWRGDGRIGVRFLSEAIAKP
jgi:hypothetical protein